MLEIKPQYEKPVLILGVIVAVLFSICIAYVMGEESKFYVPDMNNIIEKNITVVDRVYGYRTSMVTFTGDDGVKYKSINRYLTQMIEVPGTYRLSIAPSVYGDNNIIVGINGRLLRVKG